MKAKIESNFRKITLFCESPLTGSVRGLFSYPKLSPMRFAIMVHIVILPDIYRIISLFLAFLNAEISMIKSQYCYWNYHIPKARSPPF
jgi:hypothetical protein